jgi:hypothetical protein
MLIDDRLVIQAALLRVTLETYHNAAMVAVLDHETLFFIR